MQFAIVGVATVDIRISSSGLLEENLWMIDEPLPFFAFYDFRVELAFIYAGQPGFFQLRCLQESRRHAHIDDRLGKEIVTGHYRVSDNFQPEIRILAQHL